MRDATPIEIDVSRLQEMRSAGVSHRVLDVREPWETELCALDGSLKIPMRQVPARVAELPSEEFIVVICHHGQRSLQVATWLRSQGLEGAASLAGGIDAWARECDPAISRY